MKWKKFKIKTRTEAEDIIISTLYDIGLEGAQIEDNVPLTALEKEQMFVDILPQMQEDDGTAYLSFFVEEAEDGKLLKNGQETDAESILKEVKEELEALRAFLDIGEGSIEVDETEDIDWINNWKQYFKQFYVDDILIVPSWEEVKAEDHKPLHATALKLFYHSCYFILFSMYYQIFISVHIIALLSQKNKPYFIPVPIGLNKNPTVSFVHSRLVSIPFKPSQAIILYPCYSHGKNIIIQFYASCIRH